MHPGLNMAIVAAGMAAAGCQCSPAALPAGQPASLSLPPSEPLAIVAWNSPAYSDDVAQRYQEFAQAGFTHGMVGFPGVQGGKALLDAAQAAGVKMLPMVFFSQISGPDIARSFKDHPALAGYYLMDEPDTSQFPGLTRLAKEIMAIDPDPAKVICVNLLPNYATNRQMGIKPWEPYYQYVHKFMSEVPVNILSMDHYPIDRLSISPRWYDNMQVMLEAARMCKMPWWAFICAIGFNQAPEPSLGSMRIQCYTNLAYGATGIEHWYYWYYEGGRAQAIDAEGKRTATWEIDRQVNREVQAQASVFVGSDVRRVRYAGSPLPPETKPYEPRGGIRSLTAGGKGAVVSELWKGNYRFLVIVNRDYIEPMPLSVTWRESTRVGLVQKDGSVKMLGEAELKRDVEPGDAAILMWMVEDD
jgi:hypothetical protein